MKYSDVLARSFRALKSWPLWGYSLIGMAAIGACFGVIALLASLVDPGNLASWMQVPADEVAFLESMLRLYAVLIIGGLLSLPVFVVTYAGFIQMADSVLAGRPVTVGEGWAFGFRRAGRLFGIEALLYLGYLAGVFAVMAPFIALVLLGASTAENTQGAGLIGTFCLGYLWLFAGIIVLMVIYTGVEGLSSRYGLVGDRTVMDAISSGWKAFRARWKNVVVFGLIMLGLMYAWSFVTSIVTTPLMMFAMPWSMSTSEPSPEVFAGMMDSILWIYGLMFLLTTPSYIFMGVGWTAFFRQLTGLDVPVPSYYATPPAPPAATYPPMTEQPPVAEQQPPLYPPAPPQPPVYPPAPPQPPAGPSGE